LAALGGVAVPADGALLIRPTLAREGAHVFWSIVRQ
jgi:hypothetical protein